eukprot:Amastigsp_a842497_236.p2 type:complete len:155 gc:universal Amastigsp_a842497_236:259-723(+)
MARSWRPWYGSAALLWPDGIETMGSAALVLYESRSTVPPSVASSCATSASLVSGRGEMYVCPRCDARMRPLWYFSGGDCGVLDALADAREVPLRGAGVSPAERCLGGGVIAAASVAALSASCCRVKVFIAERRKRATVNREARPLERAPKNLGA